MGSVLNQADDVSLAVRRLVFGEMKVCGITRADDATRAALEGLLERGLAERIVVDGTSDGLAGGLTPENARAAAAAGAAGLDANSGVESAPGLKDPRLLALFAGAVRG